MLTRLTPRVLRSDEGIALVAAMAVALIGMSVAMIVVAQTIMVANDSGRDRVRTAEVHSAEAAIDSAMAQLENAATCEIDPVALGSEGSETDVTVDMEFYAADGVTPVTCAGGVYSDVPAFATVRATSTAGTALPGIDPERTVEVKLALTPKSGETAKAAIFTGTLLTTGVGVDTDSSFAGANADVWVDSGSWRCNDNADIQGSVYVPQGGVNIQNGACKIRDDIWARDFLTFNTKNGVNGDITVQNGNLTTSNGAINAGGEVHIAGTIDYPSKVTADSGVVQYGIGSSAITPMSASGMPVITYDPSDWPGWEFVTKAQFTSEVISQWSSPTWFHSDINNCSFGSWQGGSVINFTRDEAVYDLRGCAPLLPNGIKFAIYGDTAIFVNELSANSLTIYSGDGEAHNLYLIAPSPSATANGIKVTSSLRVEVPLETFIYSATAVHFTNSSFIRGQIFASSLKMDPSSEVEYSPVGENWFTINPSTSTSNGFTVQILAKREVS